MGLPPTIATCFLILVLPLVVLCLWKLLNWVWLRPKKLERALRAQGLQGNPYRLLVGDNREKFRILMNASKSQQSTSSLSDDKNVAPHIVTFNHHIVNKFGTYTFLPSLSLWCYMQYLLLQYSWFHQDIGYFILFLIEFCGFVINVLFPVHLFFFFHEECFGHPYY